MHSASLPMYDLAALRQPLADFWRGLARHMRAQGLTDVPPQLRFGRPVTELWNAPSLILSQCCGYDVVRRYQGRLTPLAVPHYDAPGCTDGYYSSLVVVHEDSPFTELEHMAGTVAAINGPESHSGMSALRHLIAPFHSKGRFFAAVKVSGAHLDSAAMVASRAADLAAIDCITYRLMQLHRPRSLARLRVLTRTELCPAPPYVTRTAVGAEVAEAVATALLNAGADPGLAGCRQALLIKAIAPVDGARYQQVLDIEHHAVRLGYPTLQ